MTLEEAVAKLDHDWCPAKYEEEVAFKAAVLDLCLAAFDIGYGAGRADAAYSGHIVQPGRRTGHARLTALLSPQSVATLEQARLTTARMDDEVARAIRRRRRILPTADKDAIRRRKDVTCDLC